MVIQSIEGLDHGMSLFQVRGSIIFGLLETRLLEMQEMHAVAVLYSFPTNQPVRVWLNTPTQNAFEAPVNIRFV